MNIEQTPDEIRGNLDRLGTCGYCGAECGPNSVVCVACTFNPKRRREYAEERNAPVHIEDDDE